MTKTLYVACVDKRFVRFTEHKYDMTGYGGSTGSTFSFSFVRDISRASLCERRCDVPPFNFKFARPVIRKVQVTTVYKLL